MVSNLTNLTNVSGIYDAAVVVNSFTNNLFFGLLLIAIFFVIVINLRHYGVDRASVGAAFPLLLASILLWRLALVSILFPVMFGLILAGSAFYIRFSSTPGGS